MRDDLRERREQHLRYLLLGIPYSTRVSRLADEFDVTEAAIKKDETRMDDWIEDVEAAASVRREAAFILHRHRSQTEALERLARSHNHSRREATSRRNGLMETFEEYRGRSPAELGIEPDRYYSILSNLAREMNQAGRDAKDWAREERLARSDIVDSVMEEFGALQSIGEIEKEPDRIEIDAEERVTERKLFSGLDLSAFPGIDEARLVGADLDRDDLRRFEDGKPVPMEEPDDVGEGETTAKDNSAEGDAADAGDAAGDD